MTESSLKFRKKALLEGNKAGKLPTPAAKKWGWWYWPLTIAGIATGTYWGTEHIERQVETAAPLVLEQAGINTSNLQFDATYRHIKISGALPADASPQDIKLILAKYSGPNGESIRSAEIQPADTMNSNSESTAVDLVDSKLFIEKLNTQQFDSTTQLQVAALVSGENLTLTGAVPSVSHSATLVSAALLAFQESNIDNQLTVTDQPTAIEDADLYVSNLAGILSNLKSDITDAHLNLNNDLLTGYINTTDSDSQKQIQAKIQDTNISVQATTSIAPDSTEALATSQIESLHNELALLENEIQTQVIFAPASAELPASAHEVLEKVAQVIKEHPLPNVEIGGHTDSKSSATSNIILSEKRAQAVADYIAQAGVDSARLQAIGYGESHPLFSNDTADNRAKNRRVEFWAHQNN